MKNQPPANTIEKLAVLFSLLILCDNYKIQKRDSYISLNVYKNIFSLEIKAENEFEIATQLGDWLMKLPKGVWD